MPDLVADEYVVLEVSLTRAHKIAERLMEMLSQASKTVMGTFASCRVRGYSGPSQLTYLHNQVEDSDTALNTWRQCSAALVEVRSVIGTANSESGVLTLLSQLESANRQIKLLKGVLDAQSPEMVAIDDLPSYTPLTHDRPFGGDLGGIPVRTLSADRISTLTQELATLRSHAYQLSDLLADANRLRVTISLPQTLASLVS